MTIANRMQPYLRQRLPVAMKFAAIALIVLAIGMAAVYTFRTARIPYKIALVDHAAASKTFLALNRAMAEGGSWLTLQRVQVPDFKAAADALQSGASDFAVIRPDVAMPSRAREIVTLSRDSAFLIVPAKSPIESLRDLQGQTVGMVLSFSVDETLLDRVLGYYSIPLNSIKRETLAPTEAGSAIRQKTISAIFVVARPTDAQAAEAFASVAHAMKATPSIITFSEAEAIPGVASSTIAAGAFGGREPQPEEEETTVGVSYVLAARDSVSNAAVGELTKLIFDAKARLALINASVKSIEVPDPEDRSLNLHPGAKSYFANETTSLFDRFESLFWLGYMIIPLLGSGIVWLIAHLTSTQESGGRADINALVKFLKEVRTADQDQLKALQRRLDEFVERLVEERAKGAIESEEFSDLSSATLHARNIVADRRTELSPDKPN
jgi:TRAP transporter TAXI family solute receptor